MVAVPSGLFVGVGIETWAATFFKFPLQAYKYYLVLPGTFGIEQ